MQQMCWQVWPPLSLCKQLHWRLELPPVHQNDLIRLPMYFRIHRHSYPQFCRLLQPASGHRRVTHSCIWWPSLRDFDCLYYHRADSQPGWRCLYRHPRCLSHHVAQHGINNFRAHLGIKSCQNCGSRRAKGQPLGYRLRAEINQEKNY